MSNAATFEQIDNSPMTRRQYNIMGAAIMVAAAFVPQDATIAGVSAFYPFLILAFFFTDVGCAIVGPYAAEVWPTNMQTRGMGSAYGFGGVGKILGLVGLALIAGSTQVANPEATIASLTPGFIFLACFAMLAGSVYLFFGIETKGRSFAEIDSIINPRTEAAP